MIWKEQYRIGIDRIDRQHMELFRRVSDFVETLQAPGDWEAKIPRIQSTVRFMQDYVVTHFHDEEVYQRQIGYPAYPEHARIHAGFTKLVQDFAERFEREGYRKPAVQQLARLLAWLVNHVVVDDHKIADYVHAKEGEASR